jgi:hypothetical protein
MASHRLQVKIPLTDKSHGHLDDSVHWGSSRFRVQDETTMKTLFMQTMTQCELVSHGPYYVTPVIKAELHLIIVQTAV